MKVVLATRNRGKVTEIAALFADAGFELVTIDALAPDAELREDGVTFEANALAKARQASAATGGTPALADDSGLEVEALDGAPGVYSARYAGEPCDDARNNAKLLAALEATPSTRRGARFRCAAAFVDPQRGIEIVRMGDVAGEILTALRGTGGFGYDPLFLVPSLGRTMAEIPLAEKNRLSHRARAFTALAEALGRQKKQ